MRLVNTKELITGNITAMDIFNGKGVLLVRKGASLSKTNIASLNNIGLEAIYIEDELSDGIETHMPISEGTLQRIKKSLYTMDIDAIMDNAKLLVDELSDNLFDNDMVMLKNYDDYTMQHSINVAVLATVISKSIGMLRADSERVAQAGLLHDIGKLKVPYEIITKPGKLTDEEYDIVKKHPQYGYDQLFERSAIWSVVRVGVLEHHENVDGSGYPKGLTGDKIHAVGKILHIADVYDALTTKRSYKESWTNKDAMDYIVDNAGKMFDSNCVEIFTKCLPVYRKGSIVILNNGEEAIVMRSYAEDASRPVVRTVDGIVKDLLKDNQYSGLYIENQLT